MPRLPIRSDGRIDRSDLAETGRVVMHALPGPEVGNFVPVFDPHRALKTGHADRGEIPRSRVADVEPAGFGRRLSARRQDGE